MLDRHYHNKDDCLKKVFGELIIPPRVTTQRLFKRRLKQMFSARKRPPPDSVMPSPAATPRLSFMQRTPRFMSSVKKPLLDLSERRQG